MRIDCDVINDLLPLYVENIASEASKQLVEEHCASCEACSKRMNSMGTKDMEIESSADGLKKVKRDYRQHIVTIVAFAIYITLVIAAVVEGKFFMDPSDVMGYGLLYLYLILPLGAMVCSGLLGTQRSQMKFVMPWIFGVIGVLFPWMMFASSDVIFFFIHFISAMIGLGVGCLIRKIHDR